MSRKIQNYLMLVYLQGFQVQVDGKEKKVSTGRLKGTAVSREVIWVT
jgi:hypothetical protein